MGLGGPYPLCLSSWLAQCHWSWVVIGLLTHRGPLHGPEGPGPQIYGPRAYDRGQAKATVLSDVGEVKRVAVAGQSGAASASTLSRMTVWTSVPT